MRATGIPSHFLIATQITALQEQVAALQEAGRIERTELVARVNAVPGRVVDAILANISIGGAHPVTRDDLTALSTSIVSQVLGAIDVRNSATAVNVTDEPPPVTTTASEANRFSTWMWEGRMHPVPQSWKLPRPCVKTFFLLWYLGNVDEKVGPRRSLCRFDVSPSDWVEVCRARSLFRHLESVIEAKDISSRRFGDLDAFELGAVADKVLQVVLEELYGSVSGRDGEKCVGTIYNKLKERKEPEHEE